MCIRVARRAFQLSLDISNSAGISQILHLRSGYCLAACGCNVMLEAKGTTPAAPPSGSEYCLEDLREQLHRFDPDKLDLVVSKNSCCRFRRHFIYKSYVRQILALSWTVTLD